MASVCMKRLAKERERFAKDDSEFWVHWKDDNLRKFEAYIIGPDDSVYKHKLLKLQFDIPDQYPFVPPKVTFVQHTGDRLHPNFYKDGKVCLSILGTWAGPGWSQNMTIETILRTLRSLLDNKPYTHEPHQADRPQFSAYVRYHSWRWLLLDYLERERDGEAKAWLEKYVSKHGRDMIAELEGQKREARASTGATTMASPYAPQARHAVDYDRLLADLKGRIPRVVEPAGELMPHGQVMNDAKSKRKLPWEEEWQTGNLIALPAKKRRTVVNAE